MPTSRRHLDPTTLAMVAACVILSSCNRATTALDLVVREDCGLSRSSDMHLTIIDTNPRRRGLRFADGITRGADIQNGIPRRLMLAQSEYECSLSAVNRDTRVIQYLARFVVDTRVPERPEISLVDLIRCREVSLEIGPAAE